MTSNKSTKTSKVVTVLQYKRIQTAEGKRRATLKESKIAKKKAA